MTSQSRGSSLLIFAKEPTPGRVKTRLGLVIGMELSAGLAEALLEDTLALAQAAAKAAAARLVVVHAPDAIGEAFASQIQRAEAESLAQGEGDLGQRLARTLSRVHGVRVVLGMDAPDLPAETLADAFERLRPAQSAVLGPCADGGYYLLGLGAGVDAAFLAKGIRWSAQTTLEDTRRAMAAQGLRAHLLSGHTDVDELKDLRSLAARLRSNPEAAPSTRRWLERHASVLAR